VLGFHPCQLSLLREARRLTIVESSPCIVVAECGITTTTRKPRRIGFRCVAKEGGGFNLPGGSPFLLPAGPLSASSDALHPSRSERVPLRRPDRTARIRSRAPRRGLELQQPRRAIAERGCRDRIPVGRVCKVGVGVPPALAIRLPLQVREADSAVKGSSSDARDHALLGAVLAGDPDLASTGLTGVSRSGRKQDSGNESCQPSA